jgi:predicted ATP-dependent endonuclease of OLD family
MKLEKCRVQNYRCITDSGWVNFDDITVIVGRNESGKTSFLKALWRLNPYHKIGYNIDREWPSGRRKEKSPDKVVVEAVFSFSDDEQKEIIAIHGSAKGIQSVQISRNFAGEYEHLFSPKTPSTEHGVSWVVDLLNSELEEPPAGFSEHFLTKYKNAFSALLTEIRGGGGSERAVAGLAEIKAQLSAFRSPNNPPQQQDQNTIPSLSKVIDEIVAQIEETPLMRVVDYVHKHMPTFIYMDDYRTFVGSAQLDEVQKHKNEKKLKPEEETIIMIMDMAGLDLDDEVAKGNKDDREQRMLDMNDASNTLTELISERWSQRRYQVVFQADGQHFMTFVKDQSDKGLVPLEERSKGFQWFFSFDMHFMYETEGNFSNAIILLDEPGLHLHAAAQRDLLERIKAYAKENQLVYTTHLPFMIDFKRLDNIYVAEEIPKEGTKIHTNWATADKDARFTLQAALGLSWSQSLFVGQYNLVVEGVDDFWFLTTFSTLFEEAGQVGLDSDLVVTPAGGASKVAYVGTILHGQELHVAVLLDSDPAGEQAFEQLVHQWILDEKLVVMVGDAIGSHPCALEDLFGEAYYVAKVEEAYTKELAGKPLTLESKTAGKKSLVHRVEDAFEKAKLGNFNKGRIAKRIMTDLGKADLASLDKETVASFRKVIDAVNQVIAKWKQ